MMHNGPSSSPRPVFRVIESNPYMLARFDSLRRLILVTRRQTAYPDMNTLHWAFDRLMASYSTIVRSEHRIIVDVRAAPSRNDEAFETALAVLRPASLGGFSRVVIFVRSLAGKLQVSRHAQTDGMDVFVCSEIPTLNEELGIRLDEAMMADPESR